MKTFVSFILLLTGVVLIGAEYSVEGLSVSDFDDEGRRLHRLVAVSATGPIDDPKLTDGRLEFFDVQNAAAGPVGVLTFADATFHRVSREIEGEGPITYSDAHGAVRGRGFKYSMTDGHLLLYSDVVLEAPSAHVIAKQCDAFITKDPKSSRFGVSVARLLEKVVLTGSAVEKAHFDRAETDSATYTASDAVVTLSSPVILWSGAKKSVAEGESIKYFVGKKPIQPPVPTSADVTPAASPPSRHP